MKLVSSHIIQSTLHVPSEQQNLDNPENPVSSAGNEVYSIAPGEGKHPIHFMRDKHCEELSFPTLFPTGQFGYQIERTVPLSPMKYFNARQLNYTGRFASNPEYLFFAQYIIEQSKVQDGINIALKKFMEEHLQHKKSGTWTMQHFAI